MSESTSPQMIPFSQLRTNEDYQPRFDGIVERHVQLLMASDPATWPPLLVNRNDQGGYDMVDGFHRLEAGSRLGLTALPCIVDPSAGYSAAVSANLRHGLPLRLSDRKAYARWLAEGEPALSLREIGRRAGLNHETVKRALEEEEDDGGGNRQQASTRRDPIPDLVLRTVQAYQQGWGRTWLGFGKAGNPTPFHHALMSYAPEHRPTVARAMDAFGRACVEAAGPFLGDGS